MKAAFFHQQLTSLQCLLYVALDKQIVKLYVLQSIMQSK